MALVYCVLNDKTEIQSKIANWLNKCRASCRLISRSCLCPSLGLWGTWDAFLFHFYLKSLNSSYDHSQEDFVSFINRWSLLITSRGKGRQNPEHPSHSSFATLRTQAGASPEEVLPPQASCHGHPATGQLPLEIWLGGFPVNGVS